MLTGNSLPCTKSYRCQQRPQESHDTSLKSHPHRLATQHWTGNNLTDSIQNSSFRRSGVRRCLWWTPSSAADVDNVHLVRRFRTSRNRVEDSTNALLVHLQESLRCQHSVDPHHRHFPTEEEVHGNQGNISNRNQDEMRRSLHRTALPLSRNVKRTSGVQVLLLLRPSDVFDNMSLTHHVSGDHV